MRARSQVVILLGLTLAVPGAGAAAQTRVAEPDKALILFESTRDGNSEIYVMRADGTAQRRLTDNPAAEHHPEWSPDGSMIAFESDRDGNWEI